MKLLSFSGAATKIAAHAAHGKGILEVENFKPNIVAGVSSGALVILPLLLGKHRELKKLTTTLKLSDIFDSEPVNNKGKVTAKAIINSVFSGALGSMVNLELLLRSMVSETEFNLLMGKLRCPLIYVGVTNVTKDSKDSFELVRLNELSYDLAISYIVASCSIPIYSPPVKINDSYYFDGGLKMHNPATAVIRKYKDRLTEVYSVYSRPENDENLDFGYSGKSIGRTISKTFDVIQSGISFENQKTEKELSHKYGIKLVQKFSPRILKGIYDVDNNRLKELYNAVITSYRS